MKIYRMTATFGKLENQTLTLEPGLNVIHAPNEWGKSTWCAFLCAMLYGLDTRAKSTKTTLADKERYAPWSGSPMAGSMDIHWDGRDITLQRRTKGRTPMGQFRAFETESGLDVPELTAQNCGQMLLGVEQSVFRRAGFIRLSDMPVTQDQALARRLSALVTTGDESGDGELLAKKLKELKNRIRSNRTTGLLPQAELERESLEETLGQLEERAHQSQRLEQRLGEVRGWIQQLENHKAALDYGEAQSDVARVAAVKEEWEEAARSRDRIFSQCIHFPPKEEVERKRKEVQNFRDRWYTAMLEDARQPEPPQSPDPPGIFADLDLENARTQLKTDIIRYRWLQQEKQTFYYILAGCCLVAAVLLLTADWKFLAMLALAAAIGLAWLGKSKENALRWEREELISCYGSPDPEDWSALLEEWQETKKAHELAMVDYRARRGDLDVRLAALEKQRASLCGSQEPEVLLDFWKEAADTWERHTAASQHTRQLELQYQTLAAMVREVPEPAFPDTLTYTRQDTDRLLQDALSEQQRLLNRLGQYQGQMEAMGELKVLEERRNRCDVRIRELEKNYTALMLAMETLAKAKKELQRRFSPGITKRAQELISRLTLGRYQRLSWDEDLSLHAGAEEEDTLREALWRSDGTADQLYLSLRLAVAEVLTPDAPLVLDDALVRFDEERMKAAMEVLKEMAKEKQVILFTCQGRENQILS